MILGVMFLLRTGHSHPIKLSDKVELAQLQILKVAGGRELKIVESVAAHWNKIGIAMNFDKVGEIVNAIKKNNPGDVTECCEETFRKWLQGKGTRQPATWSMLITILRECSLNALAKDIEDMLIHC